MLTVEKFDVARKNLSSFILYVAQVNKNLHDVKIEACNDAPNDYNALVAMWKECQHTGKFLVWNGKSNSTVYTSEQVNHAFRFWHDMIHIEKGLQFTTADEIKVGMLQVDAVQCAFGADSLEAKIMYADTVGQTLYAANNAGEFPENQLSYVFSFINNIN